MTPTIFTPEGATQDAAGRAPSRQEAAIAAANRSLTKPEVRAEQSRWRPLRFIEPEGWFSTALVERTKEANGHVEMVLESRKNVDRLIREARTADPVDFDVDNIAVLPLPESSRLRLLQEEVRLRRELAAFDDLRHAEMVAEADRLFAVHQDAKEWVAGKLVALGYTEPTSIPAPDRFQNGWILAHPRVRKAHDEHSGLLGRTHSRDFARENQAAIDSLISELDTARRKALPT